MVTDQLGSQYLHSTAIPRDVIDRSPIVRRGKVINKSALKLLEDALNSYGPAFGRKWRNYLTDALDLTGHLAYDICIDRRTRGVICGCGVYSGNRYPQGVFRVMNRSFVMPDFRQKGPYELLSTRLLLGKQLDELKDEISACFVSREGPFGHYFLKRWSKQYSSYYPGEESWQVPPQFFKVVPKGRSASAYQSIAFRGPLFQIWQPEEVDRDRWLLMS